MRRRFTVWVLLYAIIVIYCSTVVGPRGFNFVPKDLNLAWHQFLSTSFWNTGSDQRADWMANLLMLVPLGYLLMGGLGLRRGIVLALGSSVVALAISVAFVLAVKFLQLFFPPRTVSLNYITAQIIGSALGILSYWLWHSKILNFRTALGTPAIASYFLTAYALAYFAYQLLPLDFTLSYSDLHDRLLEVPHILFSWPAPDRPRLIRMILIVADMLAAVPLGLLAGSRIWRASIIFLGIGSLIVMTAILVVKIFLISGTPYLVSIFYRTAAVMAGVWLIRLRGAHGFVWLRPTLRRTLPLLIPLYVLAVLGINGLLQLNWRSRQEAMALFADTRALLPFWNWYIVSKARAVQSLVVHAIMFLPVGIMFSVRKEKQTSDAWIAAFAAFGFELLVEAGKCFTPGEFPDFYEAIPAALAAGLTVKAMPSLWRLFEMPVGPVRISGKSAIGTGASPAPRGPYGRARN
jgi:VanZ family protein